MRWLRQLVVLAVLLPMPALAQFGPFRWLSVDGQLEGYRPIALEVWTLTEINPRPPPPLMMPGWVVRPGLEARIAVGMPGTGYELHLAGGYLAGQPGSKGTLRPAVGMAFNLPVGGAGTVYLLGAAGLWMNRDGLGDAWGPALAQEFRAAVGVRARVLPTLSVTVEVSGSTLTLLGDEGMPLIGIRIGGAISPPPFEPPPGERVTPTRRRR